METTSENSKYRLYALMAGDAPSDAEFYFLLPDIDLIYAQEAPPNAIEIENPEQIPYPARIWLAQSIGVIAERYLRDNTDIELDGSKAFLERLRMELDAEMQKESEAVKDGN